MGKKSPRLNDFRSGEMTPGLGTRSDLAAYSKGCILMKNCMPLVEGGVERVPGTRFLRTVKQTEEGWSLKITKSGTGEGDVDSNPLGIDCGPTCYTFFADGASINLTAEADVGSAFKGWSGDGTGTPIRTVVMNGNKVVNAKFSSDDYLIAWYKFDEGSGTIVYNKATGGSLGGGLLPNLNVSGDLSIFWNTKPGFGYTNDTEIVPPTCWASKILSSTRTIGVDFSIGIFFKRVDQTTPGGWIFELNSPIEETITFDQIREVVGTPSTYNFQFENTLVQSAREMETFDWHFLFLDDTDYPKIVKPDGTIVSADLELTKFAFILNDLVIGAYYSGGEYGGGSYGSFGDWIIYNNYSSSAENWAIWYDQLRSRYGMAARSGW